ncbi:MAG: hypothetical protein NC204_07525 [Candidatus Amulumruptor caecigallinarius]|nr:hypothetical protein [Candidatus Amulumruptor caecigallinarius]
MDKQQFIQSVRNTVQDFINNFTLYDSEPRLRVDPVTRYVNIINGSDMAAEIEDADEAVENAAAADGSLDMDATDYQVKQNPDFYPVKSLLRPEGNTDVPYMEKIEEIADKYF